MNAYAFQGCAKVLINGTAEGIAAHVTTLFGRGMEIVKELRRILTELGFDADGFLPLESEAPLIIGLKAIMHDTCHTANLAAKRIIEAKNEAGVATFGAAGWPRTRRRRRRRRRRMIPNSVAWRQRT